MSSTAERRTGRPAGLDASTMAEAFQLTVAAHPDRVALRLKDDEMTMSWGEYARQGPRARGGARRPRPRAAATRSG